MRCEGAEPQKAGRCCARGRSLRRRGGAVRGLEGAEPQEAARPVRCEEAEPQEAHIAEIRHTRKAKKETLKST